MGGKHKQQAQKVKNNLRPSSSGRTAELMPSMNTVHQFSALKDMGIVSTGLTFSVNKEELDITLNKDFQIIFKRMNKKDSITKLKVVTHLGPDAQAEFNFKLGLVVIDALQEFAELVSQTDEETLKNVLVFWIKLYGTFITDVEHRVREATHNAQLQIILKNKKSLAPYLKQIIGPWFVSQFDTFPLAASAASKAFAASFPSNKAKGCILVCQKEILEHIYNKINDFCEAENTTTEDYEVKCERILVSSLQAYNLYLTTLSKKEIKESLDLNHQIIHCEQFNKLASHKSPLVRATWFKVLSTVLQKVLFLFNGDYSYVVKKVLSSISEKDAIVVPSLWEAVILIMDLIEEWWKYVNLNKDFLTKLWKKLKEKGHGSASVIYPTLLPVLSKIPPSMIDENVYNSLLKNLSLGLNDTNINSPRSELTIIARTIVECLQYIVLLKSSDSEVCKKLIQSYLFTVIEWSFQEKLCDSKSIFKQIGLLVLYWSRNANVANYKQYAEYFWINIDSIFANICRSESDLTFIANKQIMFVKICKSSTQAKKSKVTFAEDDNNSKAIGSDIEIPNEQPEDDFYFQSLDNLACGIVSRFVVLIHEKRSDAILEILVPAMKTFESEGFLKKISKNLNEDSKERLIGIFDGYMCEWLKCSSLNSVLIVDLTFLLFKHLNGEDKKKMLDSFYKVYEYESFGWCVSYALSLPYNKDTIVQDWLKNDKIADYLQNVLKAYLGGEDLVQFPSELTEKLLKLVLSEDEELLNKETLTEILQTLQTILANPGDDHSKLVSAAQLASYILESKTKHRDQLLLAVLTFCCSNSDEAELNDSWQRSVSAAAKDYSKSDFEKLVKAFAEIVENEFASRGPEFNFEALTEVCCNFAKAATSGIQMMAIEDVFDSVFNHSKIGNQKQNINNLCYYAEYLSGTLCSPYEELSYDCQVNEMDVLKYVVWSCFKLDFLSSFFGEEDEENQQVMMVDKMENNAEKLADLLHDLAMTRSYLQNYNLAKYSKSFKRYCKLLLEKISFLVKKKDMKDKIKTILFQKISNEGKLWCKAAYLLHTELSTARLPNMYKDYLKHIPPTNKLSVLHLTQTFGKDLHEYMPLENMGGLCENVVTLRSFLHCEEIDVPIAAAFAKIENLRNENIPKFFYEKNNLTWSESQEIIETVRFFSDLIVHKMGYLNRRYSDFAIISLVSWTTSAFKARFRCANNGQIQAFTLAVSHFYSEVSLKVKALKIIDPKNNLACEWEDLFVHKIHADLLQVWLYLAEKHETPETDIPLIQQPFLQKFGKITRYFNHRFIINNEGLTPNWPKFFKCSCRLLTNSSTILQLWGYQMLLALVPGLIEIDLESINAGSAPNSRALIVEQIRDTLVYLQQIVNDLLLEFKVGENSCQIKTCTDSFTYVFGYLLMWCVMFNFCEKSPQELRYQYADWLKREELTKNLFNNLFRMIPVEIFNHNEIKAAYSNFFLEKPDFNFTGSWTSEQLERLVCWVFALSLSYLPVSVRHWWSDTEPKVRQVVEKITTLYLSTQLCNQELQEIAHYESKFKNMVAKVMPTVREVTAVYTVDDSYMELVVTLPANYPLSGPDVKCNRQIAGTFHKQWLMQLKKCLLHQNGRIWDALLLWNSILDKKFDGVEECNICFSVLHPDTYQLPKLSCRTCKKKFHSACLYKWFSTSNKSSCPICRNLF